jgi:ABC-type hemin transport system substrate-binding protein
MQELSEIGRMLSEGKLDREIMQEVQINTIAQYLGRPEQAQALTKELRRLL